MSDAVTLMPAPAGLRGELRLPGDKSISHRAVLFAALAKGTSHIRHCSLGQDNRSTIAAVRSLGVSVQLDGTTLVVDGRGWEGLQAPDATIHCGNSGTTMRLLCGVLCGRPFVSRLDGDASLRSRPMDRVVEPLARMGARIQSEADGQRAPLRIEGAPLHGITYTSPVASAQVKSALLLAGLQAHGTTRIIEPVRSRDHTERLLSAFGISLATTANEVAITGPRTLRARDIEVPGDLSSAAFFIGGALVIPGSELHIRGVGLNPTRTGVIDILRAMGGNIGLHQRGEHDGEPVGDLTVRASQLSGITIDGGLVVRAIDEFPLIAVVAACARGTTEVRGAGELRVKESDRIGAMTAALRSLGVRITEQPDGFSIEGGRPLRGGTVDSGGDHRVAMALAIAGLAATAPVVVQGASCVDISFPDFYSLLRSLTSVTVGQA